MDFPRESLNTMALRMKIGKTFLFIAFASLLFSPDAFAMKVQKNTHKHARSHVTRSYARSVAKPRAQRYVAPPSRVRPDYADIVIDARTGRILHAVAASELRHPASLTKMMTLYITFQALEAGRISLGQYLPVSQNASYQAPSKLGLKAGQRIRVDDAIRGVVTESANDAAVVLGEALGGSETGFANMMTRQARALGMTQTRFQNPSGLPDPDQITSARDMAILGAALINHYPKFYPYFSAESFTYAGRFHRNHNHLMERYEGMDGIKTGYIRASGFNLVSSVKRGDTRLIGVVLGGASAVARDNQMAQLLDAAFDSAETQYSRVVQVNGEGDMDDDSAGDVALPAKVAAVFPSAGAAHSHAALPAPPKPESLPARAEPVKGNWGVQIGAYSNPSVGRQALASLRSSVAVLPRHAEPQVQEVSAGGTTLYRARFVSLDQETAQNVCSYLVQRSKSCLTVEQ